MLILTLSLITLVVLIIIFFALALYLVSIFPYGGRTPPFVPSNKKLTKLVAETLDPKPESIVYELGAGDMRISLAAWRQERCARYIGIEKHLYPRMLAHLNIWRMGASKNVSIREADLYTTNLSSATHIYCYLFPEVMQKLLPKFQKELKPGSVVVALDFAIKDMAPERTIDLTPYNLPLGKKLYVYRF